MRIFEISSGSLYQDGKYKGFIRYNEMSRKTLYLVPGTTLDFLQVLRAALRAYAVQIFFSLKMMFLDQDKYPKKTFFEFLGNLGKTILIWILVPVHKVHF